MDTLTALRNTSKGKLKYDSHWYREGGLGEILTECTSPPSVPYSPKSPQADTIPERTLPVTGLSFTEAEEEEYKRRSVGLGHLNVSNDSDKETHHNESCNNNNSSTSSSNIQEEKNTKNFLNFSEMEEILTPEITAVDRSLKRYDDYLENGVRKSLKQRRSLFEQTSKYLEHQAETALIELYLRKDREAQQQLARALAEKEAQSVEAERFEQQCKEKHKQHAKLLDIKLREAQARKKQQEEEEEARKQQESVERLDALSKIQMQLKTTCTSTMQLINSCHFPQLLQENAKKASHDLAQTVGKMDNLLKQAQMKGPQTEHVQEGLELARAARGYHDIIEKATEAANKQGKAAIEAAQKDAAAAPGVQNVAKPADAGASKLPAPSDKTGALGTKSDVILCVDEKAFVNYQNLQTQLKAVQDSFVQLTADPNLKKYKFDLQKAVNTPINAIAPTSGSHLRDKLQRLLTVLQGGPVEVGGRRVNANDHVAGKAFVKDLFAQKVVKQGEQQVASNFESAFAIAAVVVGVWCEIPEAGDLILAHLHQKCPYIVPYYMPKKENQTSEDYYKSLGYLYTEGAVEKQDKFLARMSGLMRLYGSIIISNPPRSPVHPHPHGLEHAWKWLAHTLNLHPRPDITATMIYDLLQVTGHGLLALYKKQFVKMLQALCTHYMPKIKEVTPAGSGGPVVRLENFLKKCISSNSVPPPAGMLTNFWTIS